MAYYDTIDGLCLSRAPRFPALSGSLILFFQGISKTMRTEAERVALQEKRELQQTQMGVDILLK